MTDLQRVTGIRLFMAIGLILALQLNASPMSAQNVVLRMQPEVGLTSRYSADLKFWVVSALIPQADPSAPIASQTGIFTQVVTDVSEGLATIRTEMVSSRFRLPAGLGISPPDLSGLTILIEMDARGRVVESSVDAATVPPSLRGLEEQVRQMISGISLNFPEEAVEIGSTWTSSNQETIAGPVGPMVTSNEVQYTLLRVNTTGGGRIAIVEIDGTLSQRTDEAPDVPAMLNINISGSLTGEFAVDLDAGRLLRLSNSTRLEGEVRVGNSPGGMPIMITSTTTIEFLD